MLLWLLLALAAIVVVLFLMLLPGEASAAQRAPFWGVNHAHRGLHSRDKTVPENSLAAFTAAVDAGYGIELDLQLTADGEVVVFHDDDLARMCSVPDKLGDLTFEQLRALRLLATDQPIPTLREVLALVDEKVPLIIELKSSKRNTALCQAAWKILRTYDGDICVESFDPRIVRWFKMNVPGLLRGQLTAPPKALGMGILGFIVGNCLCNFLGRPGFIACQKGKRPFFTALAQRFCMSVVYTARPEDDTSQLELDYDAVIFEFYEPEPRYMTAPGEPENDPVNEDFRF